MTEFDFECEFNFEFDADSSEFGCDDSGAAVLLVVAERSCRRCIMPPPEFRVLAKW